MPTSKRDREILRALCAEIHPDDGTDPRFEKKLAATPSKQQDRKLQQLCKQVMSVLHLSLFSAEELANANIVRVEPFPNASRLRVVIAIPVSVARESVAAYLERCRGFLRCEIARAISRKRAPELVFSVIMETESDA